MVSKGLFGNLGDPGRSPVMGVVADKPKREEATTTLWKSDQPIVEA
jgi:hypothetical protein